MKHITHKGTKKEIRATIKFPFNLFRHLAENTGYEELSSYPSPLNKRPEREMAVYDPKMKY